jgi:two-component system cell cycle response regulator
MDILRDELLGVVLVDDDCVFREVICAKISQKSSFAMFQAGSADELFEVLSKQKIDCMILDYDMGNDSGFAIKQRVDESHGQHPPAIMMTGDGRQSTAIRAFRLGINDYLPKKDLRPDTLVSSVLMVVERSRKALLPQAEHERLVAASEIDVVTGVEGRVRLDERLNRLASLPPAARSGYAIVLVELVEYQNIIEVLGLKGADQALRAFGKRLQPLIRSNDVCGRYADGVFLVIADVKSDLEMLDLMCRRLMAELSHEIRVDAVGIELSACVRGRICENAEALGGADLIVPVMDDLTRARGPASLRKPAATTRSRATQPDEMPQLAADAWGAAEHRREARQRVFKRGLLHVVGSGGTFNCMVRNTSSRGAWLRLDAAFATPEICGLEIAGSGKRDRVAVRWQIGADLGVEYVNKE